MTPYEALYGRKCKTPLCWIEVGEVRVHDLDLVQYTSKMVLLIKEHLKTAFSRQKSYADPRRKDVEFAVGDYVFLKVSPMKRVMRFGKKGKLAPCYIGPFGITDKVVAVAHRLELSPNFSHVHLMFYISMFRKYVSNPSHVLQQDTVELNENLTFEEQSVAIVDYQIRQLQSKQISMVKVLWRSQSVEKCIWESE
ncbi:uncharacterized protein LOC131169325 [Hevea brasiliensis]|uniref:uncharacterized protein LOC131169325 n=1 Tax=Hevea brasiliensis TaxID=3981 RepID=UPI0025F9F4B7|nr:uncharacterized protein LOC131169325 [Hevea brasiliensis]